MGVLVFIGTSWLQCSEFLMARMTTHLPIKGCKQNCEVVWKFDENRKNVSGRLVLLASILK